MSEEKRLEDIADRTEYFVPVGGETRDGRRRMIAATMPDFKPLGHISFRDLDEGFYLEGNKWYMDPDFSRSELWRLAGGFLRKFDELSLPSLSPQGEMYFRWDVRRSPAEDEAVQLELGSGDELDPELSPDLERPPQEEPEHLKHVGEMVQAGFLAMNWNPATPERYEEFSAKYNWFDFEPDSEKMLWVRSVGDGIRYSP